MATGNLDQETAFELLDGIFVGRYWGDPEDDETEGSRIFTNPFGQRHDTWVRLVAGNQKGTGAQINWGNPIDGSRTNTNTVTLVAPSTAPTHVEFYSVQGATGEATIAKTPINNIGAGATVVFNPGSISFRWGKAKPGDGDVSDNSTSALHETKLALQTLKDTATAYNILGPIYKKYQHSWIVLCNASNERIASPDNRGNLTFAVENGINLVKNSNAINIQNNTGSTFVVQSVEVWVYGSNTESNSLTFDPNREPQILALSKQLSQAITVNAGQAVNIPAGAFKVRAS